MSSPYDAFLRALSIQSPVPQAFAQYAVPSLSLSMSHRSSMYHYMMLKLSDLCACSPRGTYNCTVVTLDIKLGRLILNILAPLTVGQFSQPRYVGPDAVSRHQARAGANYKSVLNWRLGLNVVTNVMSAGRSGFTPLLQLTLITGTSADPDYR